MTPHKPNLSPTPLPDPEAALLARAYSLILSWPCPTCGKSGLCECCTESAQAAKESKDSDE